MDHWDPCSDCKRQAMLTGKDTESLFSLSAGKRKKASQSLHVLDISSDTSTFGRDEQRFIRNTYPLVIGASDGI